MISLVDCHAHIHGLEFDADRAAMLDRASAAGVRTIVTAGTDVVTSTAALALAERESGVWATAGIHPHEAAVSLPGDVERLAALATSPRVVAIGEIGLDYHHDLSPRTEQTRLLEEQLELADALDLPAVFHSRDADDDTFAILAAWSGRRRAHFFSQPFGVMHCYAYGPTRLSAYLELGLFISVPGIVTYPKATEMQATAAQVSEDALLLETDCPYLAPQSRRGRRNEPSLLLETAARVAALRGMTLESLTEHSTVNAHRLYRIPLNGAGAGVGLRRGDDNAPRRRSP